MSRILVIEDNASYAELLQVNLERSGYIVATEGTGVGGLEAAQRARPDLVILDLMLPTMNGFTVLQRMRALGLDLPVLLMTARAAEDDKLRGFGLGADDYVVKPCSLREILARVRVLLKRANPPGVPAKLEIRIGDLVVDLGARTVTVRSEPVTLRAKEFDLLSALMRHRGRAVSRDTLLREVWGYASGTQTRTLDTHLATLRQRIGDDPDAPQYILTVRGFGYRLAEE